MKTEIGAITAPVEVLNERYMEFFDDLASEDSGRNFAYLAAFINRLSIAQLQFLNSQLQKKLQCASKIDYHPGIIFYTWNLLKRMPKLFTNNHTAVKTIAISSLNDGLINFCQGNKDYDYESAFRFFAVYFESQITVIIATINAIHKPGPYYNNDILKLSAMDELFREHRPEMFAYFLDLLGIMFLHCDRGYRFPINIVIEMVAKCLKFNHNLPGKHALNVLLQIAKLSGEYFLIISSSVLQMVSNFDLDSEILYKFLLDFNEIACGKCKISKYFPCLLLQFADGLKNNNVKENDNGLLLVGRDSAADICKQIQEEINATVSNMDLLGELVLSLIEKNPASIPVETLVKIQKQLCGKILSFIKPSVLDLKLLNAFLALSNEKLPSPCQVARTVYSRYNVNSDKELSELAKTGRMLCEAQRSSRFIAYDQQIAEFIGNTSAVDDIISGDVSNGIIEDVEKENMDDGNQQGTNFDDIPWINIEKDKNVAEDLLNDEREKNAELTLPADVSMNDSNEGDKEKEITEKEFEQQNERKYDEVVEMIVDDNLTENGVTKRHKKENVEKVGNVVGISSPLEDGEIRENVASRTPTSSLFKTVMEGIARDYENRKSLDTQKKTLEEPKDSSNKTPQKDSSTGEEVDVITLDSDDEDGVEIISQSKNNEAVKQILKQEAMTPNRKRPLPEDKDATPANVGKTNNSAKNMPAVGKNILDMLEDFLTDC